MSKLINIQEAILKLTSDEIRQLTIWLLTHKQSQSSIPPCDDCTESMSNPYQGFMMAGSTSSGKSNALNRQSGKQP